MYAYYPGSKTLVIDHLVIDRGHRGGAAFQICAQLLYDAIQGMGIEVDFTVAEIEKGKGFGGDQTGGERLARLLGQVEFGEVHVPYFLPNMEAKNYEGRYEGILMMRGPERLYQIRREDLLAICHSVFFEHYLSWYRDFFTSEQIAAYEGHLELLLKELRESLSDKPIVKINGADPGGLIAWHNVDVPRSPEAKAAWYAVIFVMLIGTLGVVAKVAQIPAYFLIPAIIALVMAFLVVVIAGSDRGLDVFERILTNYFGDRQRSRYRRTLSPPVSSKGRNPKAPFARRNSDDE